MSNHHKATMRGKFGRIRALSILKMKLSSGMSNELLAEHFGMTKRTVTRDLQKAVNLGLLEALEDSLVKELGPLALEATRAALKDNNHNVALEVLKGLGLLKKQVDPNSIPNLGTSDATDNLEIYIRGRHLPQANDQARLPAFDPIELTNTVSPGTAASDSVIFSDNGQGWLPEFDGTTRRASVAPIDGELADAPKE